jgi:hypothetical protein
VTSTSVLPGFVDDRRERAHRANVISSISKVNCARDLSSGRRDLALLSARSTSLDVGREMPVPRRIRVSATYRARGTPPAKAVVLGVLDCTDVEHLAAWVVGAAELET